MFPGGSRLAGVLPCHGGEVHVREVDGEGRLHPLWLHPVTPILAVRVVHPPRVQRSNGLLEPLWRQNTTCDISPNFYSINLEM